MSSNPALDRFWREFKVHESSARLGGIDADKPGYHEKRNDLIARGQADDYSIAQVAADRRGPGDVGSAIDITLPPAEMQLYTGRLRVAALGRDPRLYRIGAPILREYIGTTNGTTVECYVFTGGRPLGVGADAGFDPGRDESHLWHIHLSVIRQFALDWPALAGVLSVLKGQSLADWQAETEINMATVEDIWHLLETGQRPAGQAQTSGGGVPVNYLVRKLAEIQAEQNAQKLRDQAILDALQGTDSTNILARIDQHAAEAALRDAAITNILTEQRQLLAELDAGTLTQDELVSRIRVSIEPTEPDNDGQ